MSHKIELTEKNINKLRRCRTLFVKWKGQWIHCSEIPFVLNGQKSLTGESTRELITIETTVEDGFYQCLYGYKGVQAQ